MPYEFLAEMAAETGMPLVERLESNDLDAILPVVAELDDNSEGFVLNWGGYRVKVKGEEYKRLHRLFSGITPASIAESWFEGGALELAVRSSTSTPAAFGGSLTAVHLPELEFVWAPALATYVVGWTVSDD